MILGLGGWNLFLDGSFSLQTVKGLLLSNPWLTRSLSLISTLRNLCVPLRLCGYLFLRDHVPQRRRGTQSLRREGFKMRARPAADFTLNANLTLQIQQLSLQSPA